MSTQTDECVALDTMRLPVHVVYTVGSEQVAPDTHVFFATDGEVRVHGHDERHAEILADLLTFAEFLIFGQGRLRSRARRTVLTMARALNRMDMRGMDR